MENDLEERAYKIYLENCKVSAAFLMAKLDVNYDKAILLCKYCNDRMNKEIGVMINRLEKPLTDNVSLK